MVQVETVINWDMIYRYNRGGMVTDYNGNTFQKGTFTAPAGLLPIIMDNM
jgi:hypothetical protein